MTTITEKQYESLKEIIYDSLIANPENGLGEMGACRDEAERIADEWMEKENITFEKQTFMDNDNKPDETSLLIEKTMKESYNMGIDRAIAFCESQKAIYSMIDPSSPVPMVIDSIIKTLHHFKKA